jgi:hypothetical protein
MSGFLSASFDQRSLSEIAQLYGFQLLLSPEIQQAMSDGGQLLVEALRNNMHWMNPTGTLSDSWLALTTSPYEIQVSSADPKAARRNWGFSGQTDRLGRYFANDPGSFYIENGMSDASALILSGMDVGALAVMARLGGA